MAEAFRIFAEKYVSKGRFRQSGKIKSDFEKLKENQKEFIKFLDKYREIPFQNIKIKRTDKKGYDIKNLFPRSSKQRLTGKKDIWKIIDFGIKNKKNKCSICNSIGTKKNTVLIFPFERKILNYFTEFQEDTRINLCPVCQRVCFFSFGNIYYNRSGDRVSLLFLTGIDYEKIVNLSEKMKQLRITAMENNPFANLRLEHTVTAYPFEYLLGVLFEFYKRYSVQSDSVFDLFQEVDVVLTSYLVETLKIFDICETLSRLDRVFQIFRTFDVSINRLNKVIEKKGKRPINTTEAFYYFFNDLLIEGKEVSDRCMLRERWARHLLTKWGVDYLTLNEIVMENIRKRRSAYQFIQFYDIFIESILSRKEEMMEKEVEFFNHLNSLGYALGKSVEEGPGESALWDIFRTRTAEDFVETLVRVQLKMRSSLDLREIEANKQRWREVKAIILNGMANALFGEKRKKKIKEKKERG